MSEDAGKAIITPIVNLVLIISLIGGAYTLTLPDVSITGYVVLIISMLLFRWKLL